METECYKSLLAISRLGRDKAKIDQEIIDLVREIKVGYKNNNFNWDPTLRAKKKYIEDKITDIIYHLYSNDTPSEASRLNLEERKLFLENFQLTLNSMVRKKVNIKVQGQNEESFFKLNQEQLLNASAYRILPKDSRQRYLHSSKLMARLTVNVNKKNYNNLADALIKLYDNDPQKRVTQAKIMGPRKLGSRTDQAVIYLSEANIESAKEVSQQLKLLLPSDALIGHTPAGMKRLTTGISYSETVEGQSSSHGESRALIMAKATTESLLTGEKLKNTLPRTLQRFGYDPKDPALISQTIRDRFLQTGLNSPDQELSTIQPSRDIQQFVLNPEQFCYAYKINASYLNDIKEIPESGKVVFYRNEESEYEIKYVDETYRPDLSYALNSDFLDTSSKESDKGFSNYIDIKKTAPDNVFLFLSEVKKGSVIVTELNAEKYRVYYDARYNSSLLYDNVVMAIDERDYKNEFSNNYFVFLYFDEDWKIVIQNRNNNEGVIFEPNNVKVKSAGNYSLDEKKTEFNLYRNNIHEKLNIFSKKLDVYISTAEEYSTSDKNSTNSIHWLNLANEVKRKVQASSDELKNRIQSIESDLKRTNDENVIADMKAAMDVNQVLDIIKNKQFNEIYSNLLEVEYAFYLQRLKQDKGMDFVVRGNKSGSSSSKADEHGRLTIVERYENLLYLHKTSKNSEFRYEFNEGIKNYNDIVVKGIDSTSTSWELKKRYVIAELSAKERGALYRLIQEAGYAEYIDKILTETGKISEFFYENGSQANRLIPQDFYLSVIKSESGGRCYPLVRAMSVALAKDGQNGAGKLIDKLYVAAANPDDKNSVFLKEGLKNLHSNTDAVEASFSYGKMGLNKIQEILDVRDETMMFALNSNNHSMMLGKKIEKGEKTYYFYDPNFGVFAFDDNQSLFEAVRKFFIEKKFAPYYSAFEIDGKPAFNLVYIDTNKMGRVPIGSQLTVENLSENDDLTTIETRQNKARLILKNQDEIYQDLQLKRSLMILDANQWAEKIHEATFKLSVENELDGRWLPLFYNVEEVKEGHYRLQLIHLDDPSLTRWVETTDKTFKDFHQYSLDKMMEFGRYYHLIEEEFKLKPESAEGDSIDGLNAGIAIQSIIQWVEDRNRNENTETSDTSNLAMALKIHTYLNYTLIAHSTAKDVAHMAELVKTALRYQNKSVASSMTSFSSSLAKVANEGLSTFFNGALIGFDVYEITQAENEPQTITFGTQLAFDSASFLTSTVAIGADAFGYSTASASLGGVGVIVAGLGIGFTALVRNFAIIGEDAKAVGLYFSALDKAYQGNGYEYSKDNKVLIPKFGAVFKTIDLQANQIEFDSQYIYRTSEKSSGGGRKNYLFWAGNFPTMVHDRQQAINIRTGIGYASSNHMVDFSSQESLFLPITPKSYIKYDYNLWPGATTRHDNGFDVIRRLEQGDNFDYDFYIFPSENIITHIYHEYVNTPITVKLDNKKRNLIIPDLPKEWRGFVDYKLEGNGGRYTVNINEGVKILLSDSPIHQTPSQWFINSKEIKNENIKIFENRVEVGGVDIYIENKNFESKYYIIKNNNEVSEIEFNTRSIKTVSVDEEVWKDNIKGFEAYLHILAQEQKSHQQYVIIENYQHHGNNVGRAYFDVKTEKIIFTHSIEAEKKDALLTGVRNDKAIFYSLESPLIWVTDLNNGNILFEYRLENKMARNLEILKVWPGENTIYFSCRYQDSFEVANYQIVENNIELVSIVSTPETLVYLASTHTQLDEVEPEEILKSYLIDNKNNITTSDLKGSNLANLVMISGNDHHQTQHRYWVRPQDNKLIKPNLSASLGFGHFPVDRTLKQSHWAIPEDLHLVTSLFDSDGTEVFYFYSDKQKSLYRQEGAGQDVLNVIKPSAWFMYTPNLESVFIWKGNLLLIDSFGVVSQLSANGNSSIVALNDKWFKDHAYWWRDLEYVYRDKPVIALLGIKSVDNGKILPAWSIQGKIIIAHQLSSENELQFLGMNATRSGGLIFDKKQKKVYEQYFATEKELIAAFAEGSTLNNPADLPAIIDLYPNYQFNKVERIADGLLMSAGSGEIFYIDLVNSQSINPNHLSSSLIIKGGKEHDILSPSIIKNVKNIILSGGEGQDSYLITQEAWLNYQTIIIDNDSYDEKEDLLILPPLNRQSLMTLRQNDDLVIFDMHSSTSLIIRQVFGEQSKTHNHLNIRMHNQSYSMSLSEFTSGTIQSEGLFNIQQGGVISQSEQQTQLIIEKITAFNFDMESSQQGSVAFFPPERVLSLMPPLLPAKKEK